MMAFACMSLGIPAAIQAGACKGPWIHKGLHNQKPNKGGDCMLVLTVRSNRVPKLS